jgi:ketosteroid isomerase-like protein
MFKVMMLLKRKPGLSLEEFIERYEGEHVPLAERHTTSLQGYIRHYLHPASHVVQGDVIDEPEYDVITELWYRDRVAYEQQQESLRMRPEAIASVIADEETLFDRTKSRTVYVEDHASVLGGSMEDDLARSLRRLQDKDEIFDLVHRYSYLVDHKRPEELMELFTDDCVVDYGPAFGPPRRGRKEFRAMFGSNHDPTDERPVFLVSSHHNANVLVSFETDDLANLRTSVYAWHHTTAGGTPRVWGYYHDVVVRTLEGWKFSTRQLRVAGNQSWDVDWHPLIDPAET